MLLYPCVFIFPGIYRCTRVFLSSNPLLACSMHFLQHILVCSGSLHPIITFSNCFFFFKKKQITLKFSDLLIIRYPVLQLHYEAWVRFIGISLITVGIYAFYGQFHAKPSSGETIVYHRTSPESPHSR